MMVSHESLAGLLGVWGMPSRERLADRFEQADRRGVRPDRLHDSLRRRRVPPTGSAQPGGSAARRRPGRVPPRARRRSGPGPVRPAGTSCWSSTAAACPPTSAPNWRSTRSRRCGPARSRRVLAVAGDGSRRAALAYRSARLPVRFAGHISDRAQVAALLGQRGRAGRTGPGGNVRPGGPGSPGLRNPGGGQRGQRPARSGRRRGSGSPGHPGSIRRGRPHPDGPPGSRTPRSSPGPGRTVRLAPGGRRLPEGSRPRPGLGPRPR